MPEITFSMAVQGYPVEISIQAPNRDIAALSVASLGEEEVLDSVLERIYGED